MSTNSKDVTILKEHDNKTIITPTSTGTMRDFLIGQMLAVIVDRIKRPTRRRTART